MANKTISYQKINNLLDRNNVRASVIYDWNRNENKNCKFLPSQLVTVKRRLKTKNITKLDYRGESGIIIAASSVNGHNLTSDPFTKRGHTNYYIAFKDGQVRSYESYQLK